MTSALLENVAFRAELATTAPAVASAPQVASLLFDAGLTHAHGPLLELYIRFLDEFLRLGQPQTRADQLHLITLRHVLALRQEAEALTANPELRHDRAIAAGRFATKSQAGFSRPSAGAEPLAP